MKKTEIKQNDGLPSYQALVEKLTNLVKGETYYNVEQAVEVLLTDLKRRSIVN